MRNYRMSQDERRKLEDEKHHRGRAHTAATLWWLDRERQRHQRRADDFDRRAEQAEDPEVRAGFKRDADRERRRARELDTGVRF